MYVYPENIQKEEQLMLTTDRYCYLTCNINDSTYKITYVNKNGSLLTKRHQICFYI